MERKKYARARSSEGTSVVVKSTGFMYAHATTNKNALVVITPLPPRVKLLLLRIRCDVCRTHIPNRCYCRRVQSYFYFENYTPNIIYRYYYHIDGGSYAFYRIITRYVIIIITCELSRGQGRLRHRRIHA